MNDIKNVGSRIKDGSIKFSKDAVIFLGACNANTDSGNGKSFAEMFASALGKPVIAMKNDGVAPVEETTGRSRNPIFKYGPKMGKGKFYQVNPDGTSKSLGRNVELIKLIDAKK